MEKPCGDSKKKMHLKWETVSEIHEIYGRQKSHSNNKTIEQKTRTYKSRKPFRCANAFYFIIWRVCTCLCKWMLDVCIFNGLKSTWVWEWSRDAWIAVSCIQLWPDMQKFDNTKVASFQFDFDPAMHSIINVISPNQCDFLWCTQIVQCT